MNSTNPVNPERPINPSNQTNLISNKTFVISLIILLATIASVAAISSRGVPMVVKTNLENLPMEIAGYKATEDFFTDSVYKELNADKHVYRHYLSSDGKQVDLYIGYYGTAKGGRTGHNPYGCLPGAGWGIIDSHKIRLKVKAENYPDGVDINYILSRKGELYETVLHWYQSAGNKVLATGIQQNIQRFIGRLFHNRNDGAFVRVSVFSNEGEIEETESLAKSFAQEILNLLPKYWPVEQ
jgi:EpsI family protein